MMEIRGDLVYVKKLLESICWEHGKNRSLRDIYSKTSE